MSHTRVGLYQPFIEDRNVRRLYQLKTQLNEAHHRKLPMTFLLNRILDSYFDTHDDASGDLPSWVVSAADHGC